MIMRGPGTGPRGHDPKRLGKPCPASLAEWLFCEGMSFALMPEDMIPGATLDEQPMDTYLRFSQLVSFYSTEKERLTVLQQRKMERGSKRRR